MSSPSHCLSFHCLSSLLPLGTSIASIGPFHCLSFHCYHPTIPLLILIPLLYSQAKSDAKRQQATDEVCAKLSETLVDMEKSSKTASKIYARGEAGLAIVHRW